MADPLLETPEQTLSLFQEMVIADRQRPGNNEEANRWLFIDQRLAGGALHIFNFYGFEGGQHVLKFFQWLQGVKFIDYFEDATTGPLVELSVSRDQGMFNRLGIEANPDMLAIMGLYNAQDYLYQRIYPVPDRQKVRRILDFGAGHGRMANLALGADTSDVDLVVAVDSIAGSYLTQRLYYSALDCKLLDYLDNRDLTGDFESIARDYDIVHLPTWRIDLLPDNFFDMICCVQVLREIPQRLFLDLIAEFRRVLRPGGALYIRDLNDMHNPNQLPQDLIVSSSGFLLEFYPRVVNLRDIHGIPRIWRKFDPEVFITVPIQQ